jgi:hypothetical protein
MARRVTSRPFSARVSEDLEQELDRGKTDAECLRRLLHELSHRSTPKALALKARVEKDLEAAEPSQHSPSAHSPAPSSPFYRPPVPIGASPSSFPPPTEQPAQSPFRADSPNPEVTNVPGAILEAWIALVGNRELWRTAGLFSELDTRLPTS